MGGRGVPQEIQELLEGFGGSKESWGDSKGDLEGFEGF